MHSAADPSRRFQTAVDWAVFGLGALALSTAIAATVMGTGKERLADAAETAQADSSLS